MVESFWESPGRIGWRDSLTFEESSANAPLPAEQLVALFSRIRERIRQSYIPVGIALADPWVHQVVMGFESLPRRQQEREALIHWRLARDWQRDAEEYVISWQELGERDGQSQIIVQSIHRARLNPLVEQARAHGIMLSGIDTIGNLFFNRCDASTNSMLLYLQPEYWTVYLTDPQGQPVHRRSKWQSLVEEDAIEPFVAELERMQRSVNHAPPENLTVVCPGTMPADLETVLGRRLGITPQHFDLPGVPSGSQSELLAMQAVGNLCH